ncbi:MAG: adenosylhomocysteinase [Patescibacteria group bacterium]
MPILLKYDVKNLNLARAGKLRIEWAERQMDVLRLVRYDFAARKPLKDVKVAACLHVTAETANLANTLKAGGAKVFLCASNPLSTQDDVAASLVRDFRISVFAKKGEDRKTYYKHLVSVLSVMPTVTMDDGADLVSLLHSTKKSLAKNIIGGSEETTTGVIRLRALERKKLLKYPIIAVNDAQTKHFFDNRYGTGQSTIDGILRATNILFAGKNVVVCGYGWCGKGVAMRASGLGANVIICEIDSVRALEARMDGYDVMPIGRGASVGDIFVTVTGNVDVIDTKHFLLMKDGAIVANSGHFNVELNLKGLKKITKKIRKIREYVVEHTLTNGRRIYVLGEGRLINLAAAEGHPPTVMDMSFANQALACEYLIQFGKKLDKKVYSVPERIDQRIAALKLKSMGIKIDKLTIKQRKYLKSWEIGT